MLVMPVAIKKGPCNNLRHCIGSAVVLSARLLRITPEEFPGAWKLILQEWEETIENGATGPGWDRTTPGKKLRGDAKKVGRI